MREQWVMEEGRETVGDWTNVSERGVRKSKRGKDREIE